MEYVLPMAQDSGSVAESRESRSAPFSGTASRTPVSRQALAPSNGLGTGRCQMLLDFLRFPHVQGMLMLFLGRFRVFFG